MEANPNLPPGAGPAGVPSDARTWNMLCHLLSLTGLLTGLGFVLGPLLVWILKRDAVPSVDEHGKESLNFQITVLIGYVGVVVGGMLIGFLTCGIGWYVAAAAGLVLGVVHLVLPIIASVQAFAGGSYRYPFILRLIK